MSGPTTAPVSAPLTIPMGFGAQIKALQEQQRQQADRIAVLEHKNALLQSSHPAPSTLLARIEALEQQNTHLTTRRKEAVTQLLNLRTLHQEASNAFLVRASDIEADDLEGMLGVHATSITTVLNHHQRALGQLRPLGHMPPYGTAIQGPGCYPVGYAYPTQYNQTGYCQAHHFPYPCRVCGH
ncbi:uncharacterized protein EKO05_0009340 [Ascochyta rabiei]|uniref:Uncharacterized protein n=1 Tax=Didymella rabiei TaxID=5454 RepID=A0A163EVT6_DIDRA|nr:uncharacterized protein EKO05_0009340 [Ascochyta rabiei]KZM23957.1 hypothetical protein ST47_g4914 [Ascochyta rabiei]UPX19064.1 hypothetical protein EKO05_0009340 [Ascochyta rabiei]